MHALYSYFTYKNAMKEFFKSKLVQCYSFDPTLHAFFEKTILEKNKKQAVNLFDQYFSNKPVKKLKNTSEEISKNVDNTILDFQKDISNAQILRKKEMFTEARSLHKTYIKLLTLPIELAHLEKLEKEKHTDSDTNGRYYPFIEDETIKLLEKSEILKKEIGTHNINWKNDFNKVEDWYKNHIVINESLEKFFFQGATKEKNFLGILFKQLIFKNNIFTDHLTIYNLQWVENAPILKSLVIKTLKELVNNKELSLIELTKNGEEDFEFLEVLFDKFIEDNDYFDGIINNNTKNWDIERVTLIDKVLIKIGLTEMINCPSIPLKVTINEMIEISKVYSTPKSKQFINGILNVLSNELTLKEKINKSGRGLMDNK